MVRLEKKIILEGKIMLEEKWSRINSKKDIRKEFGAGRNRGKKYDQKHNLKTFQSCFLL